MKYKFLDKTEQCIEHIYTHMTLHVRILQCTCTLSIDYVIYPLYDVASLSFDVTGLALSFAKDVQGYNNFCMP